MPKRGSGCRPKKAVREEVLALKAELGRTPAHKWQRAQYIMNEMARLCEVQGAGGALMQPRACRACGFYGHSRNHCVLEKQRKEAMTQRELEMDAAYGYVSPQSEAECKIEGQWAWLCKLRAQEARAEEALARGMGCKRPRTWESSADVAACDCEGCVEWAAWMRA